MLRAAATVGGLFLLGACHAWEDTRPRVVQIVCRPQSGSTEPALHLALDLGRKRAAWENAPRELEGALEVRKGAYEAAFRVPMEWRIRIDRYDGAAVRESGPRPINLDGAAGKGNVRSRWSCAKEAEGPKL